MNPLLKSLHPTMAAALAPFMAKMPASPDGTAPPAMNSMSPSVRFHATSCSQCGQEFGPGDHGFSHCQDHLPTLAELDAKRRLQIRRAELREEYDAGLDSCPPARDWSEE